MNKGGSNYLRKVQEEKVDRTVKMTTGWKENRTKYAKRKKVCEFLTI